MRLAISLLVPAIFTAACSGSAAVAQPIPGTRVSLEQVLFLPGLGSRYQFRSEDWKVCRNSDHASGARLGLLGIVLFDEDILRLGNGDDCNVVVTKSKGASEPTDMILSGPGCSFAFGRDGMSLRSVRVTPRPFSPAQYEKCFFRLGLFIKGFNGALVIQDSELFVPYRRSFWSTHPSPPQYVPLFQYLLSGCSVDISRIKRRADVPRDLGCKYRVHQR